MKLLFLGITLLVAMTTVRADLSHDVNDRTDINISEDELPDVSTETQSPADESDEAIPLEGLEDEQPSQDQTFTDENDKVIPLERRKITKRQYKPWKKWSYWSIPKEYKFPDYDQFKPKGFKCPVGCGPVAWAMIFGYYDRLAHSFPQYGYSKRLYRCINGVSGSSSCVAPPCFWKPPAQREKMKKYILAIRKKLKTFCLFGGGATTPKGMKRIAGFYKARQGGNAKISSYIYWLSWTGWTRTWIRNRAISAIKSGYPAIIGIWVPKGSGKKGKAQHYPVATKYKRRSRKYRNCFWFFKWICGKWKTQVQDSFYLHMGWGCKGAKGWYNKKVFSAFVARK